MIRLRSRGTLIAIAALVALMVFLLPALVAYRYTAPQQRGEFVTRPWRGWSFAFAALAVPAGAELKTSGMALRKADWLFKGTVVDPREVQLLFVPSGEPYTFDHSIDGRSVTSSVLPDYRFIWQVQGSIATVSDRSDTIVAMLDYSNGNLLYDVLDDLTPAELEPPAESPSAVPTASPEPGLTVSATPTPSP